MTYKGYAKLKLTEDKCTRTSDLPIVLKTYVKGTSEFEVFRDDAPGLVVIAAVPDVGVEAFDDFSRGHGRLRTTKKGHRMVPLFGREANRGSVRFERPLAGIEFDDQVRFHDHRVRHVRKARGAHEGRGQLVVVDFDVVGNVTLRQLGRFEDCGHLLGLLADLDHVAFLHAVGGDVHLLAVHAHVAVVHELAGGEHGGHELRAIDHGIKATLEQTDQVFAGIALAALGLGIDVRGRDSAGLGAVETDLVDLLLRRALRQDGDEAQAEQPGEIGFRHGRRA